MPNSVARDEHQWISVSPCHRIRLASDYLLLLEQPPKSDFVVSTVERREANGLPLMTAEIVIASAATREKYPVAETYPLHFRKTYFAARLHGDPKDEYESSALASELTGNPPPIGYDRGEFRSCLIPGTSYNRLSPFGAEPEESNLRTAQSLSLQAAAGLWFLAERALDQLRVLHGGGLAHGDAELHNCIVCPAPISLVYIDFEAAIHRGRVDEQAWQKAQKDDFTALLREAVFLQCALGRQDSELGELAWNEAPRLFRDADAFKRAIDRHPGGGVGDGSL